MIIIRSIKNLQSQIRNLKRDSKSIGFVPTMGALHAGHISLIRQGRSENDILVVSIFVNPTQFGPAEDLRRYPRPFKADVSICKKEGVDIIFYPGAKQMYPEGYRTYVFVEDLSDVLCGKFRPGHFKGVATIVTKLLNIIQPDIAYFGQKDAQQARIIQKMVRDLNITVKVKVMPTVRETSGLAISSRNSYLSTTERKDATVLYGALREAEVMVRQGVKNSFKIIDKMRQIIERKRSARIQYIEIVDLNELRPIKRIQGKILVALAVWIGKTRLIDNTIISN